MKKVLALVLSIAMLTALAACGGDSQSGGGSSENPEDQVYTFQLASVAPDGSALANTCYHFAEQVKERTDGKVIIEVFTNSKLGSSAEYIPMIQEGNIAMGTNNVDTAATIWPEFNIFNAPFVWNEKSECDAICDGEIGDQLWDILENDGLKVLSRITTYNGSGFRMVTANNPIKSPDDMKNLKIRVMENQILLAGWQAVGANPTPVAFTELFTALQQGAVDAQENPMDLIYSMKFYEVQDYIMTTNHLLQPAPIVMNADIFNSLPEEYQTILLEEGNNAGLYEREIGPDLDAEYIAAAEAEGSTFVELTDEDRDSFRALMGPVYDMVVESAGPIAEDFFAELGITW